MIDLKAFEQIPTASLATGFYADIKRRSGKDAPKKKKIILIRTPSNVQFNHLKYNR